MDTEKTHTTLLNERVDEVAVNPGITRPLQHHARFFFWVSILFFSLIVIPPLQAQEIEFGRFGNYTITLENVTMGDFTFDGPIVSGGGIYQVELIDAYVLSLIGVKYLDVGVEITGETELLLDGNPENSGDPQRSISFTLRSAYANNRDNNISDAVMIPVSGTNMGTVRFPVLRRQQLPPGPPPPPPTEAFDQSLVEETAYLYLYGEIDVGNVVAGQYSGTIVITVEYQ